MTIPTEVIIIPAEKKDSVKITDLLKRQLDEHHLPISVDHIREGIEGVFADNTRGFLLVAKTADQTIGVAYISFVWTLEHGGPGAWLEEVYVLPEWRNKGIGTQMLELAIEECMKRGCRGIDLEVDSEHKKVESLYRRFRFLPLDRQRWVRKLK
jgi:GNAT superfamily N-acetyltransferase